MKMLLSFYTVTSIPLQGDCTGLTLLSNGGMRGLNPWEWIALTAKMCWWRWMPFLMSQKFQYRSCLFSKGCNWWFLMGIRKEEIIRLFLRNSIIQASLRVMGRSRMCPSDTILTLWESYLLIVQGTSRWLMKSSVGHLASGSTTYSAIKFTEWINPITHSENEACSLSPAFSASFWWACWDRGQQIVLAEMRKARRTWIVQPEEALI